MIQYIDTKVKNLVKNFGEYDNALDRIEKIKNGEIKLAGAKNN